MPKVTATEFAEKWAKRLKAATAEMAAGADKVTEAPSQKAIAKQEKLLANLIKAIEDGIWAGQLGKVTLSDWKKAFKEKGVPRVSKGVDESAPKMREFGNWLLSRVEAGKGKIEGMPDLTLDDKINRMVTFIRHMAEEKYKKPS